MDFSSSQIYFQQQGRFSNNCAVHTVNNLLGFAAFSTSDFDQICQMLQSSAKSNGFSARTKHIMGGDYDVNVIQKAIESIGLQTAWVDQRVKYKYKYDSGTIPKGYILNIKSEQSVFHKMLALSSRHWVCVKLINCDYYLLDSKKKKPIIVEDIDRFLTEIKQMDGQIVQVRERIILKEKKCQVQCEIQAEKKDEYKEEEIGDKKDTQKQGNHQNQQQTQQQT